MRPPGPHEALDLLIDGNMRFAAGQCEHPHTDPDHVATTGEGDQRPFAAILACADSRVPVERVFDRGVGDLFVVRVVGNVCGAHEAASLEYAATELGCPLIVVLGHTGCGGVAAAGSDRRYTDTMEILLDPIRRVTREALSREGGAVALEDRVARANVLRSIRDLELASPVVAHLRREGELAVAPALYDMATGVVGWLEV